MRVFLEYSRSQKLIYRWLLLGCFLILLMVLIGGITRLTQSGLSMVKWEPIMGAIPPLSHKEWLAVFDAYKESPEFHHYNAHFTLSEFKEIYFWEYLHRLIGRIIGLIFLLPCIVFWRKGYFTKRLKKQVIIIFALGAFQGVLGWFMVKSGLVDKPHVSHYRLAAHFITALGLMVYLFWVALSLKYEVTANSHLKLRKHVKWFLVIVLIQLIYGAFVAGLKAGLLYNTFPKMGSEWLPEEFNLVLRRNGILSIFEHSGIVQFMHRMIALLLIFFALFIGSRSRKIALGSIQKSALSAMITLVFSQCVLGVITLLFAVPLLFAVLHQFMAILVVFSAFFFLYSLQKTSSSYYDSL
jgi:cytochrome c oxidase assembly protein subunit 15